MNIRIKSMLTGIIALVALSSFGASADPYFYPQVIVYNGGFPLPHHRPMTVPRRPVCHLEWTYQTNFDQWGNRFDRNVQVRVCY